VFTYRVFNLLFLDMRDSRCFSRWGRCVSIYTN